MSTGQVPKLGVNTSPLVQLDTSSKYLQLLTEGLTQNFKKSITRANDIVKSRHNLTTLKPINLMSSSNQRVTLVDLSVEGLNSPRITSFNLHRQNLKLNFVFQYKNIRINGRCVAGSSDQSAWNDNKPLLEVTGWNAAWSATVPHMIGRDHLDMNRVYTSHTQQRMSLNLKGCPQQMHDKLKSALIDRVRVVIENRLVEAMELVIFDAKGVKSDQPLTNNAPQIIRTKRAQEFDSTSMIDGNGKTPKRMNPFIRALAMTPVDVKSERKTRSSIPKMGKKVLSRKKRQTPCQQGEELDDYVDELLRFGGRLVRAMEPITTPNVTIELPDYNLKIFLYDGKGTRANKIRRVKPAWVFCNNDTTSLGITVEIEELQVAYKYRVISGYRLLFDGDLEVRLTPRAQAQFSQAKQDEDSTDPVQQRVDRVRLFRLGKVHVIIRGLGNLTQSLSMMINSYLNDNQEELQPTFRNFEGDAVKMANKALSSVNVPLLSVV